MLPIVGVPCVEHFRRPLMAGGTKGRAIAGIRADTPPAKSYAAAAMGNHAVMAPAIRTDDADFLGFYQFTCAGEHPDLFGNGLEAGPSMGPFLTALQNTALLSELADYQVRLVGLFRGQCLASRLQGRIAAFRRQRWHGVAARTGLTLRCASVTGEKSKQFVN